MSEKPDRLYATTTGVLLGSKWVVWNTPTGPNDEIMSQETADLLNRIFADAQALRRDADRYRWGVENARWIRHEHEAYVAIPVAVDAHLSCAAMRTAAIDAAMEKGDKT